MHLFKHGYADLKGYDNHKVCFLTDKLFTQTFAKASNRRRCDGRLSNSRWSAIFSSICVSMECCFNATVKFDNVQLLFRKRVAVSFDEMNRRNLKLFLLSVYYYSKTCLKICSFLLRWIDINSAKKMFVIFCIKHTSYM